MNSAALGLLLLTCDLGCGQPRPLTVPALEALGRRVRCHDFGNRSPAAALRQADLLQIGCSPEQTQQILALLSREAALQQALQQAAAQGIYPLTRLSAGYPDRLRRQLGAMCPPVLFYTGNAALLNTPCVSLVGSRRLGQTGRQFASRVGLLAAQEGFTLVSGNANGADRTAQSACLRAGGRVICFVADELTRHRGTERLLYCSETGFQLPFTTPRALHRNSLIHCMGQKVLVAQTGDHTGGTWRGTTENLRAGWSPVFVCADGSAGAEALAARGATAVSPAQLHSLHRLAPLQRSLFE